MPAQTVPKLADYNGMTLCQIHRDAIVSALVRNNGNRINVARELGISVKIVGNHVTKIKKELGVEEKLVDDG
ncbi:hypothetical protein HYX00_03015 [Candidatus Woesearchaeota archaeon]|nr:hypothetical protein [Candidatus Woesearchaeota archaeon]